ncbi:MAG: hypothetical protein AB4426_02450 [Xenococcaceae cyanobacterium]
MVQQPRREEPLYSCVVSIESVTGHQDEEMIAFGMSAEEAKSKAEQLLAGNYGCHHDDIRQLMQQARIEPLSPWCVPSNS